MHTEILKNYTNAQLISDLTQKKHQDLEFMSALIYETLRRLDAKEYSTEYENNDWGNPLTL